MTRRPAVDRVLVIAAAAFVVFSVARAVAGMAVVPFELHRLYAAESGSASLSEIVTETTTETVGDDDLGFRLFMSWWGYRRKPWIVADDYLDVLSKRPLGKTLGCVLGESVRRELNDGVRFTKVIMPADANRLVGSDTAADFVKADGTRTVIKMSNPSGDFTWLTRVPSEKREYDPVLTTAQVDEIAARTELVEMARKVRLARPPEGASGEWVLAVWVPPDGRGGRVFYLIPAELSPVGVSP